MSAKLIGQGCECVVLRYGNNSKVLKIYCSYENALIAIHNQKLAYKAGIAPQMFSNEPFEHNPSEYDDGMFKYAIISEYVRPVVREDFDAYDTWHCPISEEYNKLAKIFDYLFGNMLDLCIKNLGWTTDGRLVAIDFGALSISRNDGV